MASSRKRRTPDDENIVSTRENRKFRQARKESLVPNDVDRIDILSCPPSVSQEVPLKAVSRTPDVASSSWLLKKKAWQGPTARSEENSEASTSIARSAVASHTPIQVLDDEAPGGLPYNVCFGVLLMEASCHDTPWNPSPEVSPVLITCIGNMLVLRYEGSEESVGVLMSEALARLVTEHSVTLSGIFGTSKRPRATSQYGVKWFRTRPLRVVIYGHLSKKDVITKVLDESGLFLQRPDDSEYDRRVKYFNPMYLLRPGEEIPDVVSLSNSYSQEQMAPSTDQQLGEVGKSHVLRIFDEASVPIACVELDVKQSSRIISTLKRHQIEALAMMIEKEQGPLGSKPRFPLLWEASTEGNQTIYRHVVTKSPHKFPLPTLCGGILADDMGLGKTLSALALICHHADMIASLPPSEINRMSRGTLIVTPKSTIYGWQQQVARHIKPGGLRLFVYQGSKRHVVAGELDNFDVVLTTYDTLRLDCNSNGPLYSATWARIILDEAHKIRNRSSKVFRAACEVPARNRWCLTGTPIQNSLDDFGSLLAFIGIPPLVTREEFRFWVSSPLISDREHSFHMLRKLVRATCLRRTKTQPHLSKTLSLPPKIESVEVFDLYPQERELYDFFKRRSYLLAGSAPRSDGNAPRKRSADKKANGVDEPRRRSSGNIIVLLSVLRMICNHGDVLLPRVALEAWQKRDADIVSWDLLQKAVEATQNCCVCGQEITGEERGQREVDEAVEFSCKEHVACRACASVTDNIPFKCPKCPAPETTSSAIVLPPSAITAYTPSSKVSALLRKILPTLKRKNSDGGGDRPIKSVVFTQWTGMLDQISSALTAHLSSLGLSFVRIDGRSTLQQRREALDRFNSDDSYVVMLATIGAVGEGVDLTAASEAHIVEPHWNPMAEAQAVDRVHRIGQDRAVAITRYYVKDSIEEYIRWVQDIKIELIQKSLSSAEHGHSDKTMKEDDYLEKRWEKLVEFLID